MYDYNFYEQMDSLMVNLLVDLAINMVRVLYATVRYVLMQPIRLVEYIWYCIQIERKCDREETIRFENLKRLTRNRRLFLFYILRRYEK